MDKYAKKMRMLAAIIMLLLGLSLTTSAASLRLSEKQITIAKGFSYKLSLKGTKKKVMWKSRNKQVATVSSKGVVKAVKKGKTDIIAEISDGKKYKCKVTVVNNNFKSLVSPLNVDLSNMTGGICLFVTGMRYEGEELKVTGFFSNRTGHDVKGLRNYRIRVFGKKRNGKTVKLADGIFNMSVNIMNGSYQKTILYFSENAVKQPKRDLYHLDSCIVKEEGTYYY